MIAHVCGAGRWIIAERRAVRGLIASVEGKARASGVLSHVPLLCMLAVLTLAATTRLAAWAALKIQTYMFSQQAIQHWNDLTRARPRPPACRPRA